MAVDALDPTRPTGANQVELSAELRAIKARLVADKAGIEELQIAVDPVVDAGGTGLALLDSETADDAFTVLGVTDLGQQLIQNFLTLPEMKAFLGIINAPIETITNTSTGGTVTWPGGVKVKWKILNVPGGGSYVPFTWETPFSTICFFGLAVGYGGDQATWLEGAPTITGGNVDHNNGGSRLVAIFGLGV